MPTIQLPADATTLTIEDAAKLLANALWPDIEERKTRGDADAWLYESFHVEAQERFTTALLNAIKSDEIAARDPLTGLPLAASSILSDAQAAWLLLSRADFEMFAQRALIEVQQVSNEEVQQVSNEADAVEPWRKRARFHGTRKEERSHSPTQDTATHFGVAGRQVRADVRRLRDEESAAAQPPRKPRRK